jgi:hypothetical protein
MFSIGQSARRIVAVCAVFMLSVSGLPVGAEPMHFMGEFSNHNDVVSIPFTLVEETEDIYIWTVRIQK